MRASPEQRSVDQSLGSCWLFDLDGVVWLADAPIPGAPEAIARLVAGGRRATYFTNNSYPRRSAHLEKLRRFGLAPTDEDVLTSAEAAAELCSEGERALVLGGPGIHEALRSRGVESFDAGELARPGAMDVVVVGIDPHVDYARLGAAARAVTNGARLVGTNDDATYPTPEGPMPGGGAVLAAVAYATGVTPIVAGKPYEPAIALVRRRLGNVHTVVGDRPSTDGGLAVGLTARFALVLTGVTPVGHGPLSPEPDIEAADVGELVEKELAGVTPLEPTQTPGLGRATNNP